jgi:sugar transferase (PEP-CTERM/EpsH1 system associated)
MPSRKRRSRNGRIRVVHLVLSLDFAGLEMVVVDLARQADRSRFEPHVICLREPGGLAALLKKHGVPVHSLDCPELPKFRTLRRLVRLLRQIRPHVLHTHNPSPHMFGVFATCLARVPVLLHTKHGRNYPHKWRAVLVNRVATLLTDYIVPVSDASAQVARRIERVPERKIHVIRNGIDVTDFPSPEERPLPSEGRRAIHVGRLIRLKDQFTLLRATRLVIDRAPDFRLDIVGDGPVRGELESLTAELGLQEHVSFLGLRKDVRALLPAAEFFVLTSLSEGLSISILEAMAAGLSVVATDVGGNREVVADKVTGLLVPAQAPQALAEAMLAVHNDPELARRMGLASRARVKDEFDVRVVCARYEKLYSALLDRKPGRAPGKSLSPQRESSWFW